MKHQSLTQIFFWPAVIAVISLAGLIFALVYDDGLEIVANAAVALPVAVAFYYYYLKPDRQSTPKSALKNRQ
ncbi:hypothetical protein [Methylophilus rhizosphaerae]|nr:hypothetical protein [Methylophilus rhizosphaerae]